MPCPLMITYTSRLSDRSIENKTNVGKQASFTYMSAIASLHLHGLPSNWTALRFDSFLMLGVTRLIDTGRTTNPN